MVSEVEDRMVEINEVERKKKLKEMIVSRGYSLVAVASLVVEHRL